MVFHLSGIPFSLLSGGHAAIVRPRPMKVLGWPCICYWVVYMGDVGTTSGGPGSSCCARVNPFLSLSRSSPPPVRGFSRSRPVPASLAGFPDDDEDYDAAPNILRLEASSSSPPYWIARAERMEKTW